MRVDENTVSWLRLSLIPGISRRELRVLLARFGLPRHILGAPRAEVALAASDRVAAQIQIAPSTASIDASLEWLSAENHSLVTIADADYPQRLLEIPDPPIMLFAAGKTCLLHQPSLAFVGSRNATPQGLSNARAFAAAISKVGITIVSGLAIGIDAAAHQGAMAGPGLTIGVLGCGIDQRYPRANARLQEDMESNGLVVSEFPLGSAPARANFPRRNRVISGVSLGCLVIEAAEGSGSLITARLAADQGKEVFAIPGSIHSPVSRGCHSLIKQGAKLVESANDILEEIRWPTTITAPNPSRTSNPLTQYMGYDSVDINTLVTRSGLTAGAVSAMLLQLELEGLVGSLPGGLYQLTR